MKSMSPNNSGNLVEGSTKVSVNKYVQEVRKQVKEELLIRSANILGTKIGLSQNQNTNNSEALIQNQQIANNARVDNSFSYDSSQ